MVACGSDRFDLHQAFIDLAARRTCRDRRAVGLQLLTRVAPTAWAVPTGMSGNHVTASYRLLATISSAGRSRGGMVLERAIHGAACAYGGVSDPRASRTQRRQTRSGGSSPDAASARTPSAGPASLPEALGVTLVLEGCADNSVGHARVRSGANRGQQRRYGDEHAEIGQKTVLRDTVNQHQVAQRVHLICQGVDLGDCS